MNDIEYFAHIGYLGPEQKILMKKELLLLIDNIHFLCKKRVIPGRNSDFIFAVSSTSLKKSRWIFKGESFKIAVDPAFYTTYLYIEDPRIVESEENIILATLERSVIISQSNEKERLKFIRDQKRLIEALSIV